jgi:hypothetical protein
MKAEILKDRDGLWRWKMYRNGIFYCRSKGFISAESAKRNFTNFVSATKMQEYDLSPELNVIENEK